MDSNLQSPLAANSIKYSNLSLVPHKRDTGPQVNDSVKRKIMKRRVENSLVSNLSEVPGAKPFPNPPAFPQLSPSLPSNNKH